MSPAPLILAPHSFKGTFAAHAVADAIAAGVHAGGAGVHVIPVADGGEGTMSILVCTARRRARQRALSSA